MEAHWIRTLIGMEVREARKAALKEGAPRGIMNVIQIPIQGNKAVDWAEGNHVRTIRIQYNQDTNKVLNARIG